MIANTLFIPRSVLLLSLGAARLQACAGEPRKPVEIPPAPAVAPPAPASRARWLLEHDRQAILAKVDISDGRTLYVGVNGRRELGNGSDPVMRVPTAQLDDFVGVLRDDKGGFVFVARRGDIYLSTDPLGPLSEARPGPLADTAPRKRLRSVGVGVATVFAITRDGRLLRTRDYGLSWTQVAYTGEALYGQATDVALDSKGNGVLLHTPQRLFATHDDGATWSPLSSDNRGARCVLRDGADNIVICAHHGAFVRLDGDALVPMLSSELPPIYVPEGVTRSAWNEQGRVLLAGNRLVELRLSPLASSSARPWLQGVTVSSGLLGQPPTASSLQPSLGRAAELSRNVAAYGPEVVYLRPDGDVDQKDARSTLLRSADYGASWKEEGVLEGVTWRTSKSWISNGSSIDLAAGPKGWAYVAALCRTSGGTQCAPAKIRPVGSSAFEDVECDDAFDPQSFAFDEARDRAYALSLLDGKYVVYESPLSQNRFKRIDALRSRPAAITVDSQGTLRAVAYDRDTLSLVLHRIEPSGRALPLLYAPVGEAITRFGIKLVGSRGIAIREDHFAWETADGGESWSEVEVPAGFAAQGGCTESGCLDEGSQRIGWDLPALKGLKTVIATPDPPALASAPAPTALQLPNPAHAAAILQLSCKPGGAFVPVDVQPASRIDAWPGGVRWAVVSGDPKATTSILFGTRTAVRRVPFLGVAPKPPYAGAEEMRFGQAELNNGFVDARYWTHGKWDHKSSIDVDLAWWAMRTGRTMHGLLQNVPPFYVSSSSNSLSGTTRILDGGLFFQPTSLAMAYFIHDDGRVETLPLASSTAITDVARVGKRWLTIEAQGCDTDLQWSDDGGHSWTERAWTLADQVDWPNFAPSYTSFSLLDGKASLIFAPPSGPILDFPIDGTPPVDPPLPEVIDASNADLPCGTHIRMRSTTAVQVGAGWESSGSPVQVHIEAGTEGRSSGDLTAYARVSHETPAGKACVSAYDLEGGMTADSNQQRAFLYREDKAWSGWWFVRKPDPKRNNRERIEAAPIVCSP